MTQPTKRLVLCRGQFCNMDQRADKLYKAIKPLMDEKALQNLDTRILLTTANCLSMCGAGPNCIVQPGGKPFNHLDEETLIDIVEEHFS